MDDKITVAVISAMFGFSLPYLVSVWDRSRRAHRIISALNRELSEVNIEMKEKLVWIGRDVSEHLNEVDQERIVEFEGIRLYLGEREEFAVPRMYWKAKYTEIVEAIKDEYFSEFYVMYRLVDRFEQKFREMKLTFETSLGKKDAMALACFGDLI
jgi:transcription initiation factor IIE alpha subunit